MWNANTHVHNGKLEKMENCENKRKESHQIAMRNAVGALWHSTRSCIVQHALRTHIVYISNSFFKLTWFEIISNPTTSCSTNIGQTLMKWRTNKRPTLSMLRVAMRDAMPSVYAKGSTVYVTLWCLFTTAKCLR